MLFKINFILSISLINLLSAVQLHMNSTNDIDMDYRCIYPYTVIYSYIYIDIIYIDIIYIYHNPFIFSPPSYFNIIFLKNRMTQNFACNCICVLFSLYSSNSNQLLQQANYIYALFYSSIFQLPVF